MRRHMVSKHWLAGLCLIAVLAAWPAKSEEYPSRVITMIVPYPAVEIAI
jgi:tripartite-type tricarboxylate transporter receptor subunit TctC